MLLSVLLLCPVCSVVEHNRPVGRSKSPLAHWLYPVIHCVKKIVWPENVVFERTFVLLHIFISNHVANFIFFHLASVCASDHNFPVENVYTIETPHP